MKKNKAGRKKGIPAVRKTYRWRPEQYESLKKAVKISGIKEAEFVKKSVMYQIDLITKK